MTAGGREETAGRACPACGCREAKSFGAQGRWDWIRCTDCRTTYVDEAVDQATLDEYYAAYYGPANLKVPPVVRERLTGLVAGFEPVRRSGRLLDVGFGAGALLEVAERLGWECWGTEVSVSALEAAERTPWTLVQGDLPDADLPEGFFDVVCMVELLEHVPDPLAQSATACRLLRPGGLLYGTTPNARGLSSRLLGTKWSAYAAPEHLQLLSRRGLERLLTSAGLDALGLRSRGVNPVELRHVLLGKAVTSDERVDAAYELNTQLSSSTLGRGVKRVVNAALAATKSGDSWTFVGRRVA